ncbi:MAG: hypothetical protein Q9174_002545 [Haloplaca sp. 1 TL-2023]
MFSLRLHTAAQSGIVDTLDQDKIIDELPPCLDSLVVLANLSEQLEAINTATSSFPPHYFAKSQQLEPQPLLSASEFKLPPLDISQVQAAQAGQYWPGATASAPPLVFPPNHTLPTPPTTESDVFKPPPENRHNTFNVAAAAAQQQPSMATSTMESSGAGQSLTARRSAASNLPHQFELPPPPAISQKYMTYSNTLPSAHSSSAIANVGNLLTPPSNIPGDSLSPISSTMSNSGNGNQGVQPYTPTNVWPPNGGNNGSQLGTGLTPQPWNGNPYQHSFPNRSMFSPSVGTGVRNSSNSPSSVEGLPPPPPFDVNQLPPFPGTISMSAPSSLPSVTAQHSQHPLTQNQSYMSHSPVPPPQSQPSPVNTSDIYGQQRSPTYYGGSQPSSTPQTSQYPAFHQPSPVQQSPMSASTPQGPRISPIGPQAPGMQQLGQLPFRSQLWNGHYNLPAMPGPIMSNVHNPGGQMGMVGMQMPPGNVMSFNSGASAQMQMYGGPPPAAQNERPFRCDQCPQSFNRNHDLKRHKRIHLSVKPFPCGHCDKSFSRKDALKVSLV